MSLYRDRASGNYVTFEMALAAHPNVSVKTNLSSSDYDALDIDPVIQTTVPATTLIQRAVRGPAVQNSSGDWETTYTVVDITASMTAAQLLAFKTQLATTIRSSFNLSRDNTLSTGYQYNFSAYNTNTGVACSTLTPNKTAGVLTMQMDDGSQIDWLGIQAMASLALQTCTYGINQLTITSAGVGYTTGTGYALTVTSGNGSGFTGTIDVNATGGLTNPKITNAGTGYTGTLTVAIAVTAGTPTTIGTIEAVALQPASLTMRVYENYNIVIPAADCIKILIAAATWKSTVVFTAAGLKDQVMSMVSDTTKTAADMLAVTWTAPPFA